MYRQYYNIGLRVGELEARPVGIAGYGFSVFVNLILREICVKGAVIIMSICFISHVVKQIMRVTDGSMTAHSTSLVGPGRQHYAYDSAPRQSIGRRTPTPPRKFFGVAVALGQNQSRDLSEAWK